MDNVRDQAIILMNGRGVSCRELVEPKLAELNRNFEKVSQHIKSAKVRMSEPQHMLGDSMPKWCKIALVLEQHFSAFDSLLSVDIYMWKMNRLIFRPTAFFLPE